jgi:hypothetical protein
MKYSPRSHRLADLLRTPVYFWHLVVLALLGGAGAYYIIRTGNTAVTATSDFELAVRSFLDKIMIVRPRFKEFLLAYPALMLATGLLKRNYDKGVWLLLIATGIGQADIIDTLAHVHTPLLTSLLRILLGLVLGWISGSLLLGLFWHRIKKGKDAG